MNKSELEEIVLNNIRKSSKELFEEKYLKDKISENTEKLGIGNPDIYFLSYQALTLKTMSKALVETLIELDLIKIEERD